MKKKKVLVLAPHTDDMELGCGATVNRLIEEGHDVYCAAFSACQQSVLSDFPSDILITEIKESSDVLGLPPQNLILYDYNVRTFNFHRQEILDHILELKRDINPELVFIPSLTDIHQDHYTIAHESFRAFKFSTLLSYELPWNNLSFVTSCFYTLSEENVQKKVDAIACYKSQAHRMYANENFVRSLATIRGVQINQKYAECFEVIRTII
jgi:N-acetylglucosamine malate deacetylase 1